MRVVSTKGEHALRKGYSKGKGRKREVREGGKE
jgi:hypothetical protein